MPEETEGEHTPSFDIQDSLKLLQLRTKRHIIKDIEVAEDSNIVTDDDRRTIDPGSFQMNRNRSAYPWQRDAMAAWRNAQRRGVLKVVTGAGKTVLALQAIEELFNSDPTLRVSIVVPTIVLLNQWYQELVNHSNVALHLIGRQGGGYSDTFADGKKLMIWVINSGARLLPGDVRNIEPPVNHFLVVDECHRSGSRAFRKIYEASRTASLGLSATPERSGDDLVEESPEGEFNEDRDTTGNYEINDVIQQELGEVIYELSFNQAVQEGIIPKFELVNYAVDLSVVEKSRYDRISREIQELEREIRHSAEFRRIRRRSGSNHDYGVIRRLASNPQSSGISAKAARHDRLVSDRKRLLYGSQARNACLVSTIEREVLEGSQIIVFHEVIAKINDLYHELSELFPVVLYHSGLPDSIREEALRLYLEGTARVILSARALIEGYNVPSTDVGIIAASASSPRQRIQTIGRVLRKSPGKDFSKVYNIYVKDSADESIFARYSWEEIIGSESISYYHWKGSTEIETLNGPPYLPKLTEQQVDVSLLNQGDIYPGTYEGIEVSVDTDGRIFRVAESGSREYCSNNGLGPKILKIKGSAGTFKVTIERGLVLVRTTTSDGDWETYFVGENEHPFEFLADQVIYNEYRLSKRGGGTLMKQEGTTKFMDRSSPSAKVIIQALKEVPQQFDLPEPSRFYFSEDMSTVYVRNLDGSMCRVLTLEEPYQINKAAN